METEELKYIIPLEMTPPLKPVLVIDDAGLALVEAYLERTSAYGYDLETNVTDTFYDRRVRTIQLGDKQEQYVIDTLAFTVNQDLMAEGGDYGKNLGPGLLRVKVILQKHLEDVKRTKVGQGMQFECEMMLWNFGIRLVGIYDTLLAEKVLYCGSVHFMSTGFWGLEDLVLRYTGLTMGSSLIQINDKDVKVKTEQKSFDLSTPLSQKQIDYCGLDVRLPMAVRLAQSRLLEQNDLVWTSRIEFDATPAFADMHVNGVIVSREKWTEILRDKIKKREAIIEAMDVWLLPLVGSKIVTEEEAHHCKLLEAKWRSCPSKTKEEKEERDSYRKAFYRARKTMNDRKDLAPKCIGQALVNYSSPKQLGEVFTKLGYSKKQLPSTDDRELEKNAKYPKLDVDKAFAPNGEGLIKISNGKVTTLSELPLMDLFRLFRSVEKSITTYGITWVITTDETDGSSKNNHGLVNPFTKRIHSNINQLGAATGRTSSDSPNIQNIPKGSAYRHSFVARPGFKLLTVDYNGCELRILAELSGEKVWLEAFAKGWDVHSVGAEIIFGQEWIDAAEEGCAYYAAHEKCNCKLHKVLRNKIKAINFGLAYGMMAKKLADELGITEAEAQVLLDKYYKAFPTVIAYLEKSGNKAKEECLQRTICGRIRRWIRPTWERAKQLVIKDIEEENKKKKLAEKRKEAYTGKTTTLSDRSISWKVRTLKSSIEREGKNAPIQGANADLVKYAMYLIWLELFPRFGAYFYNMVHDELVIECPEEVADECLKFVRDTMTLAGEAFVKLLKMETEGEADDMWNK